MKSDNQLFVYSEHSASLLTTLYTLKMSESIQSVAENLRVSMEILCGLNNSRTFLHKFNNLQPGEALIVPQSSLISTEIKYQRDDSLQLMPDDERSHKITLLASLLKKSQVDLLLPLRDREDNLLFSQGSIHHSDKRIQANCHITYRAVIGSNGFLDYDFSHHHVRAGIGIEYWRNFLKLGVKLSAPE